MSDIFDNKAFDVEHALVMYALSFVTMPAFAIYDEERLAPILDQIRDCHIYLVGLVPKIDVTGARQEKRDLVTSYVIGGTTYELRWPIPIGLSFRGDGSDAEPWRLEDANGNRFGPDEVMVGHRLAQEHGVVDFKVLYIGQAFGEDGSRNALDRLRKHETVQKISLQGVPEGYNLSILMLAIQPNTQTLTLFNPRARDKSQSRERIRKGIDKLYDTSEAEQTTLYEASLIRYFQPPFNTIFKNSFPSTNLKILGDCYDKDFAAVVAEISIDELPFVIFSDAVKHRINHIARHDLHTDEARRVFFS